jgi:glyoxylase-like metal-dependent hydrolase (beta-lactamase superfamily II)
LLPGHTPGGIGIRYHDYFFSGDTLFYDGIGRTDLPLGNILDMKKTLQSLTNTLKDDE